MKVTNNDQELRILESQEVRTDWKERAEWRRNNKYWLDHSRRIALTVLNRLDETGMSQRQLAERMGCSAQNVSKLLKGQENLTLETIAKLELVLGIPILFTPVSN